MPLPMNQRKNQMMNHDDFAAFILTHGRPDKVHTYKALRRHGYTGRIVIIIDNEDATSDEYLKRFKDELYVFKKSEVAKHTDTGDNQESRRGVIYARNACHDIAKELGLKHFIELDDDYAGFSHRYDSSGNYVDKRLRNLDAVWSAMLEFLMNTPTFSIAMSQSGDYIMGKHGSFWHKPKRKCMNSFICATDRPFKFYGRINEDLTASVDIGSRGGIFLTIPMVALTQKQTQQQAGGLTELYLDLGTYVKSFYSVIYQPSCVSVSVLDGGVNPRIHHQVTWKNAVPKIISERFKKAA